MYEGFRCFFFVCLFGRYFFLFVCLFVVDTFFLCVLFFGIFALLSHRNGWDGFWNLFTRKMFVTYRAAAGQAAQIMDRKEWQLHEALPWPEWPKEFDDGARYGDGDVNEVKQLPLLQLIGACSWAQQLYHTVFAVVLAVVESIVTRMVLVLQLE